MNDSSYDDGGGDRDGPFLETLWSSSSYHHPFPFYKNVVSSRMVHYSIITFFIKQIMYR